MNYYTLISPFNGCVPACRLFGTDKDYRKVKAIEEKEEGKKNM
jgi:hypothetical protein